jgi:hypothetical protein
LGFFSFVQDALVYEVVNGPHPYFYLNPVTGNITLIKDLATTPDKTFGCSKNVTVIVCVDEVKMLTLLLLWHVN